MVPVFCVLDEHVKGLCEALARAYVNSQWDDALRLLAEIRSIVSQTQYPDFY